MNQRRDQKRVCLIILDGWGSSMNWAGNAIRLASPENFNRLWNGFGHKLLQTYDKSKPFDANSLKSDVCHTQISAGRFVQCESEMIFDEIKNHLHLSNQAINDAFKFAATNDSKVHIISPVDEDEHSIDYISAVLKIAESFASVPVLLHLITTGTIETANLKGVLNGIIALISKHDKCKIASISGSQYTSSSIREVQDGIKGYETIANGNGERVFEVLQAFDISERKGIRPEEIVPSAIIDGGKPVGPINDFDSLIFTAISVDPIKFLFSSFLNDHKVPGSKKKYNLSLLTFTDYFHSDQLRYSVAFKSQTILPNLSQILSDNGILQRHISASSKTDNVGFFFDGRTSAKFPGEKILSISDSEASRNDDVKMSANYITKVTIDQMMQTDNVFILVNFANVDYFAHTKDIKKTSSAVKFIDQCLGLLVDASERTGTSLVITSDHGNAESMASVNEIIKADQHSKNPVPLIVVSGSTKRNFGNTIVGSGGLDNLLATQNTICDIAPTILDLFGIKKPIEFTGNSLLNILD